MRGASPSVRFAVLIAAGIGLAAGGPVELQRPTVNAYDAYVARAREAFLERVHSDHAAATVAGDKRAGRDRQAPNGRIEKVAGGLVHHWRGSIHIPGVALARVLDVSRKYEAYPEIHPAVVESRVLSRDGDRFVVVTRVKGGSGGVTAVLQCRSVVTYDIGATSAYSIGTTEEIREVVHAGLPDERLLPLGRDNGYLWRAHTFTRFVARERGVDVELETLGLSRRFPRLLTWILDPIARSVGRKSVESALLEFSVAVRGVGAPPASTP
jgi:hypothetical protein